ncbi:hypothetical protein LLG95_11655 [bacterium]|nr:hypothetical protein [bacterium]
MKDFQALLLDGQAAAARARLCTIARSQPDQMDRIAADAADMVAAVYDRFRVEPVHAFCADMELDLPEPIANAIERRLKQPIERTKFWLGELPGITQERLARECRRSIVTRDYKEAGRLGAAMLELAGNQEELVQQARYLSLALATLYHDRDRVPQIIGLIAKSGGKATAGARFISEHFAAISRQTGQSAFETGEREWRQRLTQAIVHMQSWLPGPMEADEPTPEQVERFAGECMAILRASLAHGRIELFIDALTVIYDYCPSDPSRIANAAGVEDRIFTRLGPRAKLCAVRAMVSLGQNPTLRKGVLELARAPEGGKNRLQLLAGIMGGLRHEDFFEQLRAWYEKTDVEREEELIVDALGRIANPDAGEILTKRLQHCIRRIADPANERRAYVLLTGLGRLARGRGLDARTRNQIVRRVMELVENEARQLSFTAASEMFSMKLDDLDPDLRALAARKVVAALWSAAPAGATADSGWRVPMVNALKKFGPEALPDMLDEATKHATRFSGAMGSFAEALQAIGDERAVPLLESMTRIAITYVEDPKQSQIFREKVRDIATDKLVDLDRDDLVNTHLYTLLKIGGDAGRGVVLDFADQVQAGRIVSPGDSTTKILLDTKLKFGSLHSFSRRAKAVKVDERELRQAMSRAKGGLLTSHKTQIAALATLGRMRQAEAVPVIVGQLANKNQLVAGAAYAALAAYFHPLPGDVEFDEFMLRLLEDPDRLEGVLLERIVEFIRRELPKRAPYDKLFDRQIAACVEDEELAHYLRGAFAAEPEPAPGSAPTSDQKYENMILKAEPAPLDSGPAGEQPAPPPAQGSSWTNELERRRAAFRARKERRG